MPWPTHAAEHTRVINRRSLLQATAANILGLHWMLVLAAASSATSTEAACVAGVLGWGLHRLIKCQG